MGIREIQAGGGGVGGALARLGLTPLSWGYGLGVRLRGWAYDRGLKRSTRLPVPVLSVGNLVAGGTGKTPFVALLVERLRARGRRPGVLSRGYGPRVPGGLSDEGAVLSALCGADLPQREEPDRVAGGRALLAGATPPDVLVLDDGFQHRRLARDLDIVLLDAADPFGGGRLLPRGMLREPVSALARAHLVVLARTDQVGAAALADVEGEVARLTRAPVVLVRTRPVALEVAGARRAPTELAGKRVHAVAGIGTPAAFEATLRALGAEVVGRRDLADHGALTEAAWAAERAEARARGADLVVVTRKDAVKRTRLEDDVAVLDVAMEIVRGAEHLERLLP